MAAHLRLILLRKKSNEFLQRPTQVFLRCESFRIQNVPSNLWDATDLGMS